MVVNQLKTVLLLGLLTGLLLLVGRLLGGVTGMTIALVLALLMNFVSYWFSAKIVLWMYKAKEADKKQYAHLYEMIHELARKMDLPMPKIYVIDTPQANAFATGRNPQNGVVAATTGIINILNTEELKGVLAHEMGHIKNRDILISTVAATIAGALSYLASIAQWGAIFGMGRDDDNGGNVISILLLAIVTPIIAMIIQLAISRSREYLADATGARVLGSGKPLAAALQKIEKSAHQHPLGHNGATSATAHMFIHEPFTARSLLTLLSTHPSTQQRVARLEKMTF
ncbi:zinc metalloprotease HtpX [Candidatus Woesearchaeota archaeon]|nr:zinc metalloprotease HtpX [Candidatus Woesearchaeota archaeon]